MRVSRTRSNGERPCPFVVETTRPRPSLVSTSIVTWVVLGGLPNMPHEFVIRSPSL